MTDFTDEEAALLKYLCEVAVKANPDDPRSVLLGAAQLFQHSSTVAEVVTAARVTGKIGRVLYKTLIWTAGMTTALMLLTGQLKSTIAGLMAWAGGK